MKKTTFSRVLRGSALAVLFFNRSEFGIKPGELTEKVAETIHLSLSIAGAAPRS